MNLSRILVLFLLLTGAAIANAQADKPPVILEKPKAVLPINMPQVSLQGTVRVRILFSQTGKIGEVVLIKGLIKEVDDAALVAAQKIRFVPAKKGDIPVDFVQTLEYFFSPTASGMDFVFGDEKKEIKPIIKTNDEKAEAIIKKAVERLGGDKYLGVKTSVGRGFYTLIQERISGLPSAFVDYLVFPDKERTEFKSLGDRTIQTNVGETGWIFDGAARSIKDQTPQQISGFKRAMRTSLDNLLRDNWRRENAQLSYAGRREAGLGKRNEAVKLTYDDGFVIEYEFAATDSTPAKIIYKSRNDDGEDIKEEDRFAQLVTVNGITAPYIIDHFRNGVQTSRINYELIEFNAAIPDALFVKPTDVKKVK